MNKLLKYISAQFKNPRGFAGKIASLIQNIVNSAMYKKAASLINVDTSDKVMEVGYGNGHLLDLIYKKNQADLYGIDISADAMRMATKKNKRAVHAGKLHLEVGDCLKLPFDEDMFSAVTSINTIYFWQDPVKGLIEIKKVLKSGKSFYNVVFTKEYLNSIKFTQTGYKKYEREQFIQFGKEAGFQSIELKEVIKGKNYVVIYTK